MIYIYIYDLYKFILIPLDSSSVILSPSQFPAIPSPRHCVVIRQGRILAVCPIEAATEGGLAVEQHSGCLMPGLIDAHVPQISSDASISCSVG